MNKKLIILTGALVAAVLAVGAASSGAWFSDSESVAVTASSAKLDVQLEVKQATANGNCNGFIGTADAGVPVAWNLSGLAPGSFEYRCVNIQNKNTPASIPVKYRYRTANLAGDPDLYAGLTLQVYKGDCSAQGIDNPALIYNGTVGGLNGTDLDGPGTDFNPDGSWGIGLPVNFTRCYAFALVVDTTVGNSFQGKTGTFNIVADATQPANPAW